jgi:hypothetical protein
LQLFSLMGGNMGLFLGASVFSILQVLLLLPLCGLALCRSPTKPAGIGSPIATPPDPVSAEAWVESGDSNAPRVTE